LNYIVYRDCLRKRKIMNRQLSSSKEERYAADAQAILQKHAHGVLATLSKHYHGYPFGSLATYMLDHEQHMILLLSNLAQHTHNLLQDPRISMTVVSPHEDIQNSARVTYLGKATVLTDDEENQRIMERYLRYFPDANRYVAQHDFKFYRIIPEKIRYIGGFGQIGWASVPAFCEKNPFSYEEEKRAVIHMNDDHTNALIKYLKQHGIETNDVIPRLTGIDKNGLHIRCHHDLHRINFPSPVSSMDELRKTLIDMSHQDIIV
jgi:putative heme iron utilization protein